MKIPQFALFLLTVLSISDLSGESPLAISKPNIVYILADDLGYGDIRTLNPDRCKISTPNLDRLASQGMRFTDAHSGSSVCTPTRYGLLTGRYAWRTRLQRGVLDGSNDPPLIDADRLTVASFLKQNGYATAAIGKWHLGFHSTKPESKDPARTSKDAKANKGKSGDAGLPVGSKISEGPITRGFDYFWGCSNARTMSGLIENDVVIESLKPIEMLPRLGAKSVEYIGQQCEAAKNGKPFFLYVPLTSPHTPIVPSAEWQGKSELGSYGDFVMQTDAIVGEILSAIDAAGIADNTLVIFTADNGCSPAAKTESLEKQGHYASGPFRGYKADIWEGGHRVPFMVRWPGVIQKGSASNQLICHVDLLATCADILKSKLPIDAAVDSVSILPALLREEDKTLREAVVHHSIDGRFAIRQGKWKLIFAPGSGGWASPKDAQATALGMPDIQLYDMFNDPSESTNVQSAHPDVVDKLTQLMEEYIEDGRSTPGPKQTNDVVVQRMTVQTDDKEKRAAQAMNPAYPQSTDESPYYLSFRHPQNFFEIDYPAHWQLQTEEDGAVEFSAPAAESFAGLMLFRTPVSVDADQILRLGKWKELATIMFQQIQSSPMEQDPTIIYDNYRVERPEADPSGYRWFILCFDLILGVSSSYSDSSKPQYEPIIERMLSSLRIHRNEELLASQVLSRVTQSISDNFPDTEIKVSGMTVTVNQFQLSIGNLLSQVMRNPSGMESMVDHFVQGIVGLAKPKGEKLGSESWESVRERIQPLLKTDKYIQEANQRTQVKSEEASPPRTVPFLISAPWMAELRICFAIDNKDTFRFIHSLDLERWGVSLELLLNTAVENLAALPEPEVYTMRLSEDTPAVGSLQHHGGAASSYLLHPRLYAIASQQLGRSIVAAVPSRDKLMMFEYRDNRSMLQHAVERDYSTTNHPVSDRLFRITPDGVALL